MDLVWDPVVYSNDELTPNVLEIPDNVWHNRYETKKGILAQVNVISI